MYGILAVVAEFPVVTMMVVMAAPVFVAYEVRPRLISRDEIDRLADDVMRRFPNDPETAAHREAVNAWYRSEPVE